MGGSFRLDLVAALPRNMHASYAADVKDNSQALFQVLAPERATLRLEFDEEQQRYHLAEVLLRNNQPVSKQTLTFVKHWLKQV